MPTQCTCARCGVLIRMVPTHCRACAFAVRQQRSLATLEARAWARLDRNGPLPERRPDLGPCWIWTGARSRHGYGHVGLNGKVVKVHRVTWESINGPIPEGLVLDHLCRNRACARPDHLEPVTSTENLRRGDHPSMITARTGVCRQGHALTPENTAWDGVSRRCRICRNANALGRYHANKPPQRGQARGERSPNARLTDSQIREIRALSAQGVPGAVIARGLGVTKEAIYAIVKRKAWAHVD